MKGIQFSVKLNKRELILGFAYLLTHMALLPLLLNIIAVIFYDNGVALSAAALNAAYYLTGFISLTLILHNFLKESFERFVRAGLGNLRSIFRGYGLYYLVFYAAYFVINIIFGNAQNPNNDAVVASVEENLSASVSAVVLLGPFVEECLFRGVVFTGIGSRFRFLGYAVSSLLFAFLHVYQYMALAFDPALFITMLIYIPPGIVLARVYEKSGSIWNSVFLHMAINGTAIFLAYYL